MVIRLNSQRLTSEFLYICVVCNNMSGMHMHTEASNISFQLLYLSFWNKAKWSYCSFFFSFCGFFKSGDISFSKGKHSTLHSKWMSSYHSTFHSFIKKTYDLLRIFFLHVFMNTIATSFSITLYYYTVTDKRQNILNQEYLKMGFLFLTSYHLPINDFFFFLMK